eukprot:Phypoly_transcript_07617.p1 GENE.Phypoly_transcript_07617~~Phypoly_transcript_07617.p1  ORF type:complete len:508 (+),score=66.86 Phypoly_transcript_07617:81-1604(+)
MVLDTKDEEEEVQLTDKKEDEGEDEERKTRGEGEGEVEVSPEEEERVVNKVTLYLLPFLSVLYLLCFLDRANLGNAHTEMAKDLGITESEYAASVSIFYIGYVLCEVPANCMMELVQARRWLARIMFSWGIISVSLSAVQSIHSLLVLRLLLGIAEAGFFPGAIFYMTQWSTKKERAGKISILSSSSALAGLIGGLTAYAILLHMDGVWGIKGWRWILILEGIPSVIMAIVTLIYLPDTPREAKWLTPAEKAIVLHRVENQQESHFSNASAHVSRELTLSNFWNLLKVYLSEMKLTYKYPSTWIFGLACFFILFTMSSTPFFLPAVVQEFGATAIMSNLLNSVPFFFAVVLLNINSRHSDKTRERPFHIIGMCAIGIFGYILVLIGFIHNWGAPARMVAVVIAVAGQWASMTPFVAWISDHVQGNRAVGIAAVNSLGSIAGWVAPTVLAKTYETTGSYTAGLMVLGASLVCAICTVLAAKYHMLHVMKHAKPNLISKSSSEMEVLVK